MGCNPYAYTNVPVMQRDRFSAYLRKHKVVRTMSHEVARCPGQWWLMIETGAEPWIRAYALGYHFEEGTPEELEARRQRRIKSILRNVRSNEFYGPVGRWFAIRWKVEPER